MPTVARLYRPPGIAVLAFLLALSAAAGAQGRDAPPAARQGVPASPAPADPAASAPADPAPRAAAPAAGSPFPKIIEDRVRARVQAQLGVTVGAVRRMPFGLYEVVAEDEVFYVDEKVGYLVTGRVFDLRTRQDLTAERRDEALRVDFKSLPMQLAIKSVRGNGERSLVLFEDPNCPYCKHLEKDLEHLDNTTIYTFLYPILSDDSYRKSQAVWCAGDRDAAWAGLMLRGKDPGTAAADCQHPLEEVLALGHKLHVNGTPTLVFADGRRAPGVIDLEHIEQMMADAARAAHP